MKTKPFAVIVSGMAVALCLAGACFLQTSKAQTETAAALAPVDSTVPAAPDEAAALPPGVDPASPLAQVIQLIQAGVSEDVIMAYITNSASPFNLTTDQIIYLKDIGAPDDLVTAMMQRDQALQAQTASSIYPPPPQTAPAPATTVVETADVAPAPTVVTVDYFYNTLAPYGSWTYVQGYGRCWRPTVAVYSAGWQPYCDHGHWVWTDCGWYWISDYSWGWAPFHYGRWFLDPHLGWCWYPGTVWGPSWVTWRYGDGYCGWAPLPPHAEYRAGVGFFYNGVAVSVGFNFGLGVNAFTFVPAQDFCDPHPWHYRAGPREVTRVYNQTTVINHFEVDNHDRTFINRGIDPGRITAVTHREIHPVAIRETTGRFRHGEQLGRDGHTLYVNRPQFSENPPPSNRGEARRVTPSQPAMGSAYQGPPNGNRNNQPVPARNYQPARTTPPNQRQFSPPAAAVSPNRNGPAPTGHFQTPDQRRGSLTPRQPAVPNNNYNNSMDNRRYPSPRMQQTDRQDLRVNPPGAGQHVGAALQTPAPPPRQPQANHYFTPPAPPPQRSYSAPATRPPPPAAPRPGVTYFTSPAQPSAPAQPQTHNFVSPRNEPSPGGSRQERPQPPAAGNQSRGSSQPSTAPPQSHTFGGDRNQNGRH